MDLERDKSRPEMQPDKQRATPEPRVQRLGARPEPQITRPVRPPAPETPATPPPAQPPGVARPSLLKWGIGRVTAIALLLVAAVVLVGGSDVKVDPPPVPQSVSDSAPSVPDEIVVDLKDNVTDQQIADLGRSLGIDLHYASKFSVNSKLMVAQVNPFARAEVLAALRANPLVEAASPQKLLHFDDTPAPAPASGSVRASRFVPNDPEYHRQWDLTMIGMEEAWAKTKGKGATVAVIDSGVGGMTTTGAVIMGQDFKDTQFLPGYDFCDSRDITPDDVGHGTHVSGTIAESTNNGILGAGIAPEAKLIPLRVSNVKGELKLSCVADALHYAADHGANVANMSLGGPEPDDVLHKAMEYAYAKNLAMICSAGNDGKDAVGYPGKYKECITVSAIGPTAQMAEYSSWGTAVDIAAPGGDPKMGEDAMIWQNTFMQQKLWFGLKGPRVDGFFPMAGTSMAAPHVTGVAALLVSQGMTDPKEIRSQLRKTVKPHAPADHYGAGILNAAAATESVHRSTQQNWVEIALAVGAAALLLTIGKNLRRPTDPMFFVHHIAIALAVGLFFPIALEKFVGFGSWWNLVGHSVILAIVFLMLPGLDRAGFWKAAALTTGLMIHLLLDADSGRAPFLVTPQSRVMFWLYVNAGVGLYFMITTYRAMRKKFAEVPA